MLYRRVGGTPPNDKDLELPIDNSKDKRPASTPFGSLLYYCLVCVVVLALLTIAAFLFSHFYPRHLASDLENGANGMLAPLFELEQSVNQTIQQLPLIYYGRTLPPTNLAPNGSLFIDNTTSSVYYKQAGGGWFLAFNGSQTANLTAGPDGQPGMKGPSGNSTTPSSFATNETYTYGDVVTYNGTTVYISLAYNNTDIPGLNNFTWYLIVPPITNPPGANGTVGGIGSPGPPGQGMANTGAWSNSSVYNVGDLAVYNGTLYANTVANNTALVPGANPSAWVSLTTFLPGPIGTTGPMGNASAPGPPGSASPDQIPLLDWQPLVVYNRSSILIVNNTVYVSLLNVNIGNSLSNATAWTQLNVTYVYLNGSTGPPGATPPSGFYYAQQYNATTNYTQGALVQYLGSWFVLNATSSIGSTPATTSSIWSLVDLTLPGFTGAVGPNAPPIQISTNWNASVNYPPYTAVIYNNYLYLSNGTSNIGNEPNATGSAVHWYTLIGNLSLPNFGAVGPIGPNGTTGITYNETSFVLQGSLNTSTAYDNSTLVAYNGVLYTSSTPQPAGVLPGDVSSTYDPVLTVFTNNATAPVGPIGQTGPPGANNTFIRPQPFHINVGCSDAFNYTVYYLQNYPGMPIAYNCTQRFIYANQGNYSFDSSFDPSFGFVATKPTVSPTPSYNEIYMYATMSWSLRVVTPIAASVGINSGIIYYSLTNVDPYTTLQNLIYNPSGCAVAYTTVTALQVGVWIPVTLTCTVYIPGNNNFAFGVQLRQVYDSGAPFLVDVKDFQITSGLLMP